MHRSDFDPRHLLGRMPRPAARWSRLFALGTLVGVLGGLAAAALEWGLHHGSELLVLNWVGHAVDVGGDQALVFSWWIILLPTVGGLASGLVVQKLFRQPHGHGTDLLTRAFHHNMGELPLIGPAVKGAAAVGVISCGGSAGPEGPIAALGAAIGSKIGRYFKLSPRETRVMLVAGCGAGIGAIFECPLGGALFATGVLYSEPEFESEAIVPAFFASVIGYSTFIAIYGASDSSRLLEDVSHLSFQSPVELLPYALLGPLCGFTSIFFALCLRGVEKHVVRRSRIPIWLTPALGGLATGLIACLLPQVMDGQYEFIRHIMQLDFREAAGGALGVWRWPLLFGAVVVAKCVATAFTVGSGASGGVLGPSVYVGGVVGAFLAAAIHSILPDAMDDSLRQSLIAVGMAGVLAASMRTPLAAIVMVTEMTGSYGLIVPLMLVCVSAYVVGRRFGLNHEQVRSSADSPAHAADGLIHMLESWRVRQLMDRDWQPVVSPATSLGEMVQMLQPGTRPVFAVVDDGRLVGLISVPDIERIMNEPGLADAVVAQDIMTERLTTVRADDEVFQALNKFRDTHHDVLPVVSPNEQRRWVGMLTRKLIFDALQKRMIETQQQVLREHTGLRAIDREGQINQLVMAVSPVKTDTIQRLMVPLDVIGKSIREADFRNQFGINVIGIELPSGALQFPPDLDMPLQPGHRLVATVRPNPEPTDSEDKGE